MAMLTDDKVQEVIGEFKPYFLRKKLQALAIGEDIPRVSFDGFLSSDNKYKGFSARCES